MHDYLLRQAEIWKTCNKIRAAVFRLGLNLWDWYKPLDPENNSLISESKFVSILAGPLRSVIGLTNDEIAQLADYFRAQDGRVLYHQLCQIIHGEDVSQNATPAESLLDVCPPPPEPECHRLDTWQMRRLCVLLATIADRDIPLKPYFQDYELVAKNDGRITFAHFARILNYMGVLVSPEDFNLLVRRFIKDSYTLDYVAFLEQVQAVKREGIRGLGVEYKNPNTIIDTTPQKMRRPEIEAGLSTRPLGGDVAFHPVLKKKREDRNLPEIMLRVQQYVMKNSIRVSEFFRDYDPLNCGRIMPEQFRRAMEQMGMSKVISDNEAICVMKHYLDPNDNRRICWRTFEDDCDQVFAIKELEKHPDLTPGAVGELIQSLPAVGSLEEKGGPSEYALDNCERALMRLRTACQQRSIDLRPAFRDHDQLSNGHVSRNSVRRVFSRLGILLTAAQVVALEDRYSDDCGFSYFKLLDDLEGRELESAKGVLLPPVANKRSKKINPLERDIVQILAKIKGKMIREAVRPLQFLKQFDLHNELIIPRADFYRGLASAGLSLTPTEMDTLMEVFAAPGRRRFVEYQRFSDTVGEALTMEGLERSPLLEPIPHLPTADTPKNFLNHEERSIVAGALTKLAKHPDQISNIYEVFVNMDPTYCGTLPRISMEKALCQRNLLHLLSPREREIVYKCFGYTRGCGEEVDYRSFVKAIDLLYATNSGSPC